MTRLWVSYSANYLFISLFLELYVEALIPAQGEAEVNKLQVKRIFFQEQEVLRFQVSMGDFTQMHIVDGLDHLLKNNPCVLLGKRASLIKSVE